MSCSCRSGGKKRKKTTGKGCKRRRVVERDSVMLSGKNRGIISNFSITGSADPCTSLIAQGKSFIDAHNCLIKNRFIPISLSDTTTGYVRIRYSSSRR